MMKETTFDYELFAGTGSMLGSLIYNYPNDIELINQLKTDEFAQAWPRFDNSTLEETSISKLDSYLNAWQTTDAELTELQLDFGQLFIGPNSLKAVPWGSFYLSSTRLLNDKSTLELSKFYDSVGIKLECRANEPIDHFAFFMQTLGYMVNNLHDDMNYLQNVRHIDILLKEHLLPWSDQFLNNLLAAASTDFYQAIAGLSKVYLDNLTMVIERIMMANNLK